MIRYKHLVESRVCVVQIIDTTDKWQEKSQTLKHPYNVQLFNKFVTSREAIKLCNAIRPDDVTTQVWSHDTTWHHNNTILQKTYPFLFRVALSSRESVVVLR